MNKGIEMRVTYTLDVSEAEHKCIYSLDEIACVNEIPVTHNDAPQHLRTLVAPGVKCVAVLLIKQMQAFTQCFTTESYEEVKDKLKRAGVEIIQDQPSDGYVR